jgi:hypothetical protein
MTQQCQLSATVTGQSAVGIDTTVGMTIGGPAVIAATDGGSGPTTNQALVPPIGSHPPLKRQESPLLQHKDDAPVFHSSNDPRTRATDTPQVSRPVALTPWQDTRLLWQAGRHRFTSVMMTASKKVRHTVSKYFLSFFPLSFSLSIGIGKRDILKESFAAKETGPEPSYCSGVRRLRPAGFGDHPRALGL